MVLYGELLQFAEEQGFAEWNDAIEILEAVSLQTDESYRHNEIWDFTDPPKPDDEYVYSDKCREIMLAFFKHHDVDTFVMVDG